MARHETMERLIQEQKLSLEKVSELTGVSTLALEYLLENRNLPKTHVAQKIAKVLHVSVQELWPELFSASK